MFINSLGQFYFYQFNAIKNPTIELLAYVLIGNSIAGLFFGWLYWKNGLEAAFIGHIFAHVVMIIGEQVFQLQWPNWADITIWAKSKPAPKIRSNKLNMCENKWYFDLWDGKIDIWDKFLRYFLSYFKTDISWNIFFISCW